MFTRAYLYCVPVLRIWAQYRYAIHVPSTFTRAYMYAHTCTQYAHICTQYMYAVHVAIMFTRAYRYAIPVLHTGMRYKYAIPVRTCKHRFSHPASYRSGRAAHREKYTGIRQWPPGSRSCTKNRLSHFAYASPNCCKGQKVRNLASFLTPVEFEAV